VRGFRRTVIGRRRKRRNHGRGPTCFARGEGRRSRRRENASASHAELSGRSEGRRLFEDGDESVREFRQWRDSGFDQPHDDSESADSCLAGGNRIVGHGSENRAGRRQRDGSDAASDQIDPQMNTGRLIRAGPYSKNQNRLLMWLVGRRLACRVNCAVVELVPAIGMTRLWRIGPNSRFACVGIHLRCR